MTDANASNMLQYQTGRLAAAVALIALAVSCTTPGKLYPVTPEIHGTIQSDGDAARRTVVLSVRHRDNPTLGETLRTRTDDRGRFEFRPVQLTIAGQEFSKDYRLFLHMEGASAARALWRSDYSRYNVDEAIELDCDADRPLFEGMPCQVVGGPGGLAWMIEAGAAEFSRHCTACHGSAGLGDGPVAGSLRVQPADLTRIAARRGGEFRRGELAEWIDGRFQPASHGTRDMPVWGDDFAVHYAPGDFAQALVRGRIETLLDFLESIQVSDAAEGD